MNKAMKEIKTVVLKCANNAVVRVLTGEQEEFLEKYVPEDSICTTGEEMEQVEKALDLKELSIVNLRATRNAVVIFYAALKDEEERASDRYPRHSWSQRYEDLSNAMMSVTAVIDHNIYLGGAEV